MLVLRDWLKDYCGEGIPTLKEIEDLLTFHAFEIEETKTAGEHEVIDVKVLPDRAADCLSHRGIARELATLTGKPLIYDPLTNHTALTPHEEKLNVSIESEKNCTRFALAYMSGVKIGESPLWLRSRLEALGQRSINNVVDATNYVMLALGQPLHAYDAEKFSHNEKGWHFGVRMAREREEVTTLSGDTYTLTPVVQLITDASTDSPVGIAGVKGGKSAEIDERTTAIILEAAHFDPQVTRMSSQFLKLQTDASKRFENNISPELVPYALNEVVALITNIASGTLHGYVDVYPNRPAAGMVQVPFLGIQALLGVQIPKHVVEDILNRLGCTYVEIQGGWSVTPPWERMDIVIKEDIIAEIGRIYGYEHIESVVPHTAPLTEYNSRHYYSEKIRNLLVSEGFSEVITSSFKKKDTIELQNALASDKKCLRSTLRENIREVLDRNMPNVDLLALSDVRVFEIGTVFEKTTDGKDVTEHIALTLAIRTKQQGYVQKDDVRVGEVVKKVEELLGHPLGGMIERGVYECNLTTLIGELPLPVAYEPFVARDITFRAYSPYPFVSRDVALWVPEGVLASEVETLIQTHGGDLLTRVTLFDEFKKEGKVSYAFRLIFQSYEKTLTDAEVGEFMSAITAAITATSWEIR